MGETQLAIDAAPILYVEQFMQFRPVQSDIVKWEMRAAIGVSATKAQEHKKGGFGRFLSGLGRMFGAIAAPLSMIFPPAAIGAAAAYGVTRIGDVVQGRAAQRTAESAAQNADSGSLGQVFIPGLTDQAMDVARQPVRMFDPAAQKYHAQAAKILTARNEMTTASIAQV